MNLFLYLQGLLAEDDFHCNIFSFLPKSYAMFLIRIEQLVYGDYKIWYQY